MKGNFKEYPCDICGCEEAVEVPHAREYTDNQPVHICKGCGFVYVKNRRSAAEIAQSWSDIMFSDEFTATTYTARIPAVKARQTYVADYADVTFGLKGKELCDIGGGEGQFLEIVRGPDYQAKAFAVEPSEKNCRMLSEHGFDNFQGTIEEFRNSDKFTPKKFDAVTMMWTLVNSFSCKDMMKIANEMLKPGGYVVAAEGSRILVPFKKPLNMYFSTIPADLHAFHFSANALQNLMRICGFEIKSVNRYIDTDYLVVIGQKTGETKKPDIVSDDYKDVADFFERWHKETQYYRQLQAAAS